MFIVGNIKKKKRINKLPSFASYWYPNDASHAQIKTERELLLDIQTLMIFIMLNTFVRYLGGAGTLPLHKKFLNQVTFPAFSILLLIA